MFSRTSRLLSERERERERARLPKIIAGIHRSFDMSGNLLASASRVEVLVYNCSHLDLALGVVPASSLDSTVKLQEPAASSIGLIRPEPRACPKDKLAESGSASDAGGQVGGIGEEPPVPSEQSSGEDGERFSSRRSSVDKHVFNGEDVSKLAKNEHLRLARPKFNQYYPLCTALLKQIVSRHDNSTLETPSLLCAFAQTREEEENEHNRPLSPRSPGACVANASAKHMVPVGFDLRSASLVADSWKSVHVKDDAFGSDQQQSANTAAAIDSKPRVIALMLPLLAQMITSWLEMASESDFTSAANVEFASGSSKKVVILISGAGKPRNRAIDELSNSTLGAAQIMQTFIHQHYPDVSTEVVDSQLGVFHYDRNVSFCNEVLLPTVEKLRHPLVSRFGDGWKERLKMTIALTDGSPARLAALNAALRRYKPNYLHMWQLKTFWYELRFFRSDLLFQSFESMETKPQMFYEDLDSQSKLLADEVRNVAMSFKTARSAHKLDELGTFWLRKSRKCVLSVLMVQAPHDEQPRFFRGMNLEVSMPTGSLCAERNVIGSALASDQTLRREDLKMIAVLSMSIEPSQPHNIAHIASDSAASTPRAGSPADLSLNLPSSSLAPLPKPASPARMRRPHAQSFSSTDPSSRFYGEINPIQPCGACKEWLNKIAEVNPTFKIMTFTNSDINEFFLKEFEAD